MIFFSVFKSAVIDFFFNLLNFPINQKIFIKLNFVSHIVTIIEYGSNSFAVKTFTCSSWLRFINEYTWQQYWFLFTAYQTIVGYLKQEMLLDCKIFSPQIIMVYRYNSYKRIHSWGRKGRFIAIPDVFMRQWIWWTQLKLELDLPIKSSEPLTYSMLRWVHRKLSLWPKHSEVTKTYIGKTTLRNYQ